MNYRMSAIGPKWTPLVALHMSAFGGKADITSALGRQYLFTRPLAAHRDSPQR
jgi:hypothetical protein